MAMLTYSFVRLFYFKAFLYSMTYFVNGLSQKLLFVHSKKGAIAFLFVYFRHAL